MLPDSKYASYVILNGSQPVKELGSKTIPSREAGKKVLKQLQARYDAPLVVEFKPEH